MKYYKTNAQLFADARKALLGHLSTAVWSLLLYFAIALFLTQFSSSVNISNTYLRLIIYIVSRFVATLAVSLFGVGLSSIFLNLLYEQPASIRGLLTGFLENPDNCIRVRFYITFGEYVCLLPLQIFLFLVPKDTLAEIIPVTAALTVFCLAGYMYWTLTFAMANYLLLDFPEMNSDRILRAARTMMRGNRMRLFRLYLRLLPLHLLGLFSLGIANVWASCCQYASVTAFYKDMMSGQQ